MLWTWLKFELKKDRLAFEYTCPLALANPYKIYYILQEICNTGDKYDDEFETSSGLNGYMNRK